MQIDCPDRQQQRKRQSEVASMQFPVHITWKLLSRRASVHVTDGAGATIAFAPPAGNPAGTWQVYADRKLGRPIFTISALDPFTQFFDDADGKRIGAFGITPAGGMSGGKFVIVEGDPRFRFACESEWLDTLDRLIPSLPLVNALTGALMQTRFLVSRVPDDTPTLRLVKTRLAIDIRYSVYALSEFDDRELECLILSALVYTMMDYAFKAI